MTVIAVKKTTDKLEIAADTQLSAGNYKSGHVSKILQIGAYVFAASGTSVFIEYFSYMLERDKPILKTSNSVMLFFLDFLAESQKKLLTLDPKEHGISNLIIVYQNYVWWVDGDGYVQEITKHWCTHRWAELFMDDYNVKTIIKRVCEYDLYCGGHVQYFSKSFLKCK